MVFRTLIFECPYIWPVCKLEVWRTEQINLARRTEVAVTARRHRILTQSSDLLTKTFSGHQNLTAGTELHALRLRNRGSIPGKVNSFHTQVRITNEMHTFSH